MYKHILSVSHDVEVNLSNGATTKTGYTRVYNSLFTSGLVAKMGATRFTTLLALTSFVDEEGKCNPTQIQLADAIGVHKNTVNKYIQELVEFTIGGKPLVTRTKENKGRGQITSFYTIHPLSPLAEVKEDPEATLVKAVEPKRIYVIKNANDAIAYFQQVYREVYGVNYSVGSFARDGKMLKDKVLTPYPNHAEEIIDYVVRNYDKLYKRPEYPRPTIGMFSWIASKAFEQIDAKQKQEEVFEKSAELEAQAEMDLARKIALLGGEV